MPKMWRRKKNGLVALLLWTAALAGSASPQAKLTEKDPPKISSLLKPKVYEKMISDREVMTYADIDDKDYSFYASVLIRAGLAQTRKVLTDYEVYAKLIPYVEQARYSPETKTLEIQGGIWKFKLHSFVRFEEFGERWIRYRIVDGHFAGLSGDVFFESQGEKGTAVLFRGNHKSESWPPAIVMERGAEVVFTFTGRRMRSYVESEKGKGKPDDKQVPQPRSRL